MNLPRIQKNNEIFLRLESNYKKLEKFQNLLDEIDADMKSLEQYYFNSKDWRKDVEA